MDQVSKIYLCATATVCHFIIAAPAHVSETQGLCYSTSSSRKPQKAPAPRTVAAHYRSREGKGSADMETVCFPHEAAPKKLIRSSARARSRESVTPSALHADSPSNNKSNETNDSSSQCVHVLRPMTP